MIKYSIQELNNRFRKSTPQEIINWVIKRVQRPIVTTNFGPYSASLLHALSNYKLEKDIPVLWADSGYNLNATYRFATNLKQRLDLNLQIYVPKFTRGYIDASMGEYMAHQKGHEAFTQLVKIEPLQRAFSEYNPDVWFTNIRKDQTTFRATLDIFSLSKSGILKVSPFYYFSDKELDAYLTTHKLPNELDYFDPTKIVENRECGLHLSKI